MTTPTIADQKPITYGWAVYRRVAGIHWPDSGRKEIGRYTSRLWDALDMHGRLEEVGGEGEAHEMTLGKYELKAHDAVVLLVAAVRQHCGDSDAEFLAKGGLRA